MNSRWEKIEEALSSVADLPVAERESWLANFCANDASLKREIVSLLHYETSAQHFLEQSIGPIAAAVLKEQDELPAQKIGSYRIVREIGRGGMGTVLLAIRDDDHFKKQVAIKVLRRGMDSEDILRRFRNERQILASLEHPYIARLFDGGMTHDGLPYFVMEYIEGQALDHYADQHRLSIKDRLGLFRKICEAVQYAHQNLVVHRDLKPSNILITAAGEPKLLDFGIAKVLKPEPATAEQDLTRTELRVLTPDYASPEQIRGEQLTTRSDVYSLGVVLYELLTGRRPYRIAKESLEEITKAICEREPSKPSVVVGGKESGVSKDREEILTDDKRIQNSQLKTQNSKLLRGDLDNIILKALRKTPQRRYESAAQLAEDIERHLGGLPVSARKDTLQYRAAKFVQRNRIGVAAAALILLAIIGGLIATAWQARVAARERDEARAEKAKAEQLNGFLQSILSAASPEEKGKDAKIIEVLRDAGERVQREFANQPALQAQALHTIGVTYSQLGLMDESEASLREALRLDTALYGADSEAAAADMIYLSAPVLNKNKMDEAQELLQKALATERKRATGSKDLATALFFMGELYIRRGDYEKPKPLLQEAVALYDKLSGPNNEDSALTLVSLGRAQQFSGDLVSAEATYRRSAAIYRQLPARFNGRLAALLLNLGMLLTTKGNFDEGIKAMREADEIFARQSESFYLYESKTYLCVALFNKGDFAQTIAEGRRAVELARKLDLTEAPDFITALRYLGLSLTRTGHAVEAEPLLREALAHGQKSLSPGTVGIANVEGALGECLAAQGRFAAAEPVILQSYETLKVKSGEKSPATIAALKRIVDLYEKWGRRETANKYRQLN